MRRTNLVMLLTMALIIGCARFRESFRVDPQAKPVKVPILPIPAEWHFDQKNRIVWIYAGADGDFLVCAPPPQTSYQHKGASCTTVRNIVSYLHSMEMTEYDYPEPEIPEPGSTELQGSRDQR